MKARLILGLDSDAISEMVTTTETQDPSGGRVYHPQRRDDDHKTDALRCVALAIRDFDREGAVDPSIYGGWAKGYGGVVAQNDYTPPWA